MTVKRYDRASINRARYDDNGYLLDTPTLTRTGVFSYRNPDGTVRREYRPPDEVFHADSLESYRAMPITKGHPGMVNADNAAPHQIGTITSEGRKDAIDGRNLVAEIVVHDPRVIKQDGWKDVSVGYRIDLDETPGVSPEGEPYDAVQRNIRVNHLAIVPKGRAGNARLNLDSADAESVDTDLPAPNPEPPQPKDPHPMTMVKVRLDSGMQYDAAPEVEHELNRLRQDAVTASASLDKEKARADNAEAAKKKADEDIKAVREDAIKQARARISLEDTAKAHGVEVRQDATDRALRESVIKKIRNDQADLTDKSDAYIEAAYDLATADAEKDKRQDAAAQQRRATTPAPGDRQDTAGDDAASARERMRQRRLGNTATHKE